MRLFITDSGGFAGHAVATRMQRSHEVCEERNLGEQELDHAEPTGRRWTDPNLLAKQIKGSACVVHFATAIPQRLSQEEEKWKVIAGTENLLNASLAAGVTRFILVSTADTSLHYAPRINWSEQREPPREQVVGSSARIARLAEEIALSFNLRGLPTVTLRPAWLWGCGMPDPRVPKERAAKLGMELFDSGRNFVGATHIANLCEAISCAAECDEISVGHSYYIADDDMVDAQTFFGAVSAALGLPAPTDGPGLRRAYCRAAVEEWRRGPGVWRADVLRRGASAVFDTLAARRQLGWKPVCSFKDGIDQLRDDPQPPLLKLV